MVVRLLDKNVTGKIGESSPAGYTHGKAVQWSTENQVVWLHLRPCFVPSRCRASKTTWHYWKPWGISSPRGCCPV